MTTHPSDWRNAPSRTKWLALAAVIGIAGGVLLVTFFSGAAARAVGPSLVAKNDAGETLLANPSTLFVVAADDASLTSLSVTELGLRGPVMSVSSDGNHWYVGDDATGMLHRCDLVARRCEPALVSRADRRIFRRAHRVAFAGEHIFMTDSEAHQIRMFDRAGRPVSTTRTAPVALCFPNGIVAVGDALYVADTNNFRIARVPIAQPAASTTFLQVSAGTPPRRANCNTRSGSLGERGNPVLNTAIDSSNTVARAAKPPASADRVWPASVLRTSTGEWWVIQMANRMRMGEVIRYDETGTALGRVDLPVDADPIELIESRGEVLVTDAGLTQVHRVSLEGKVAGIWGPPEFQAALRGIVSDRQYHRTMLFVSYNVVAGGVLAALLVVMLEVRRQRAQGWTTRGTMGPVAIQPAELGPETVWTPLGEDVVRRTRRAAWLLAAYLIAMFAVLGFLGRNLELGNAFARVHAVLLGLVLAMVLLIVGTVLVNVARMPRRRLGVNRTEVRFESGSGKVISASWDDVRVGERTLMLGRHLVQIVDPRGRYLYPQQWLESQLLSRIPRSGFLGPARMLLEALRRGNAGMWMLVLAFASYAAVIVVRLTCPGFTRAASAWLYDWFR